MSRYGMQTLAYRVAVTREALRLARADLEPAAERMLAVGLQRSLRKHRGRVIVVDRTSMRESRTDHPGGYTHYQQRVRVYRPRRKLYAAVAPWPADLAAIPVRL